MKQKRFAFDVSLLVILAAFVMSPVAAAELDHEPLARSANLTFEQVLQSAIDYAPEALASESRRAQADQYSVIASNWFSGAPTLATSYYDDNSMTSVGLRELEAGLQFSLWRPGERGDARELGNHYQQLYGAWRENLELEIAGRLRSVIADIELAEVLVTHASDALEAKQELVELTRVLFEAGDVSQLDVIQAEALMLEQQNDLFAAEAAMVDGEREYEILTGLHMRPASALREEQSELEEIGVDHALLNFVQANIDVARSRVQLVKRTTISSPTFGIGVRRERGTRMDQYTDSLGLSFNIPIGKSATADAAISDARRETADLEVALRRSQLLLEQSLHEAEHGLFVTRQQLVVSRQRSELAEQRLQMARSAYELGETNLLAVTVALEDSLNSHKELHELELMEQRLISEYNQSLGIMP